VQLAERVAVDRHRDLLARLAGGEGQAAGGGGVVAAGRGRAVGGGGVDGDGLTAGGRQRHGERGADAAGVPLGDGHVADRQAGHPVVVVDGPRPLGVGEGGVGGAGEVNEEGLVALVGGVAGDLHRDLLARLARGERQRAGGGRVVAAGQGGAVG